MDLTSDDIGIAIAIVALAASLISLHFTKVNWLQSNRPIVTAFVTEHSAGNLSATFNLVIANTGSRPAVRVQMHASQADIASLLERNVRGKRLEMIESNFLKESEIPLLRDGEELSTSFGAFAPNSDKTPWLKYGAEIEISITYRDLDNHSFVSRQPLKIYARNGFGGGVWNDT